MKEVKHLSCKPIPCPKTLSNWRIRSTSFIDILSELYSASIVDVAMSVCNLLDQTKGQFAIKIAIEVLLLTQDGSCLSLRGHNFSKSASTKQSMSRYSWVRSDSFFERFFQILTDSFKSHRMTSSSSMHKPYDLNVRSGLECECRYCNIPTTLGYMLLLHFCLLPEAQGKLVCLLVGDLLFEVHHLFSALDLCE